MTIILRSGGPSPISSPPPPSGGSAELPRILSRDAVWTMGWFGGFLSNPVWSSAFLNGQVNEQQTGSLDYGYFRAGTQMHMGICGGGSSGGTSKTISIRDQNGGVLISNTLQDLLGNQNRDTPVAVTIETSAFQGEQIFLRFTDSDSSGASFSWIGVALWSIVIET